MKKKYYIDTQGMYTPREISDKYNRWYCIKKDIIGDMMWQKKILKKIKNIKWV